MEFLEDGKIGFFLNIMRKNFLGEGRGLWSLWWWEMEDLGLGGGKMGFKRF